MRAFSTEMGPVTTIGWPQNLYRDRFGRVLNREGRVAHIVHQYDRRKRLEATLGRRYAMLQRPEAPPADPAPVDTTAALSRGERAHGVMPDAPGQVISPHLRRRPHRSRSAGAGTGGDRGTPSSRVTAD